MRGPLAGPLEFHGIMLSLAARTLGGFLAGAILGPLVAAALERRTGALRGYRDFPEGGWKQVAAGAAESALRAVCELLGAEGDEDRARAAGPLGLFFGMIFQLAWSSTRHCRACLDRTNLQAGIRVLDDNDEAGPATSVVLLSILFLTSIMSTFVSELAKARDTSFLPGLLLLMGGEVLCLTHGVPDVPTLLVMYQGLLCGRRSGVNTYMHLQVVMCTVYAKVYAPISSQRTRTSPTFDQNTIDGLLRSDEPKDRAWLTSISKFVVFAFRKKDREQWEAEGAIAASWAQIAERHRAQCEGEAAPGLFAAAAVGAFSRDGAPLPPCGGLTARSEELSRRERDLFRRLGEFCEVEDDILTLMRPVAGFLRPYRHGYIRALRDQGGPAGASVGASAAVSTVTSAAPSTTLTASDAGGPWRGENRDVILEMLYAFQRGARALERRGPGGGGARRTRSAPITGPPAFRDNPPLAFEDLLRQSVVLLSGMLDAPVISQNPSLRPGRPAGPGLAINWPALEFHGFWIFLVSRVATEFRDVRARPRPLTLNVERDGFGSLENIRAIFSANPQGNLAFLGGAPDAAMSTLTSQRARDPGGRRLSAPVWSAGASQRAAPGAKARRVANSRFPFLAAAVDGKIYVLRSTRALEKKRWVQIELQTGWSIDTRFLLEALIPKTYTGAPAARRASDPLAGGRVLFQDGRLSSEPEAVAYAPPGPGAAAGPALSEAPPRIPGGHARRVSAQSAPRFGLRHRRGADTGVEAIISRLNLSSTEDYLLTALALAGRFESVVGVSPQGGLYLYTEYKNLPPGGA